MIEKGFSYACKELPDGTTRPMTTEERAAFKPTHIETVGERDGVLGSFTTDLATGITIFKPWLITYP